jgi:hypothetical protein
VTAGKKYPCRFNDLAIGDLLVEKPQIPTGDRQRAEESRGLEDVFVVHCAGATTVTHFVAML